MARSNAISELLKCREMQSPFRGRCNFRDFSPVFLLLPLACVLTSINPLSFFFFFTLLKLLPSFADDHESEHTHPRLQRRQSEIQRGFHLSTTVTVRTHLLLAVVVRISSTFLAHEYHTSMPRLVRT